MCEPLKLYNDKTGASTKLTAAKAITDPDFIRFASYVMGTYADRLQSISTVFNVGGKERFTPKDMLHVVLCPTLQRQRKPIFIQTRLTVAMCFCRKPKPYLLARAADRITSLPARETLISRKAAAKPLKFRACWA